MIHQQWLNTFLVLVETGHFTRTAERLFMTQPGVSQHIKKLEEQIGAPLLIRHGRQFDLTYAGEQLYRYGKRVRAQEDNLMRELNPDEPYQGEVRIGCSGALALQLFPGLMQLQQTHDALVIALEAAPNQKIIAELEAGRLDLGIVSQPAAPDQFEAIALGYESLSLVMPASNAQETLSLESLESLGYVDHPDAHGYIDRVLRSNFSSYRGMGGLNRRCYINQLNQILLPVATGLGFTVLPGTAVDQFSDQDALHRAELPVAVKDARWLLRKRHRSLPQRFDWIQDQLRQMLSQG